MPPDRRPAWARKMVEILAPTGRLLCLEFPTKKDPKLGGPPFALLSEVYEALLTRPGEPVEYVDGIVQGSRNGDGLRRIAHWQPKRTHEIGQGQDWMSVWSRP